MNITEDYVSFEIAKLLKEKGFDEKVSTHYLIHPSGFPEFFDKKDEFTEPGDVWLKCPTLQMAMKWLREVHNIAISVYVFNRDLPVEKDNITYTIDIATTEMSSRNGHLRLVGPYEQACESAIKYCLENLI